MAAVGCWAEAAPLRKPGRRCLAVQMKEGGGHVVLDFAGAGETGYGFEDAVQQTRAGVGAVRAAEGTQAIVAELLSVAIEGFGEAVGAEENGIAGLELQRVHFVAGAGK